ILRSPSPVFFFFQAEDGIRDFHVTGVQTCALPISTSPAAIRSWIADHSVTLPELIVAAWTPARSAAATWLRIRASSGETITVGRSEERRVGKEGRGGGGSGGGIVETGQRLRSAGVA